MKLADVTPVYKKKSENSKDTYRPVSILSNISKIYERCTSMIKFSVDNVGAFDALLTDLSKAFDRLPHELLIAKLDAYGFDKSSLKLIHSSLSNRKQRVKINDRCSL